MDSERYVSRRYILVNGFDGKPAEPITYAVALSMTIDGRTQH